MNASKGKSYGPYWTECSIWQLADDTIAYGDKAGHFIITTPDGEDELHHGIFTTPELAEACALEHRFKVVPLEDHIGALS